ncbi:hypothetical protein [Streptomyces sp. NPDC001404]|uniref:hypothetical protein n=1 Tax=Streptomyces sp. NPDC001404 TaxID=3364571 RepID=UPI0036A7C4D1
MGDDTLFRSLDLIQSGDLVRYHGSITRAHGLYIALPCSCSACWHLYEFAPGDTRYALVDPWGELPGPRCVRRASITRSTSCS